MPLYSSVLVHTSKSKTELTSGETALEFFSHSFSSPSLVASNHVRFCICRNSGLERYQSGIFLLKYSPRQALIFTFHSHANRQKRFGCKLGMEQSKVMNYL